MIAHYYRVRGEAHYENMGDVNLARLQAHILDCNLFTLEYRQVRLQPATIEWWQGTKKRKEHCHFGYYKGVMFAIWDGGAIYGPCGRQDNVFQLYPNTYTVTYE